MAKVLIVDDNKVMRMLYGEELKEEGYDIIATSQTENLLELIDREKPDVIVLDIMLGERNGLDLLQQIRTFYYNLPVVLCTAYSTFKTDPRSIAANYYVTKSSDLYELKLKIEMALESLADLPPETVSGAEKLLSGQLAAA